MTQTPLLPAEISRGIDSFMSEAKRAFGDSLVSAVLFGSAAEGRLRSTSDVNLLLVLKGFQRSSADLIRDQLRAAHAAIRLDVMFLLQSEVDGALDAFAVKFSDILSRRSVIFGPDPFENRTVAPSAILLRTKQVLMNMVLRLRQRYVLVSLREEQLAFIIADITGSLRACAASLLKLQGRTPASPKEALAELISELGLQNSSEVLGLIDQLRAEGSLPPGTAGDLLFSLMELADKMYKKASGLSEGLDGGAHG